MEFNHATKIVYGMEYSQQVILEVQALNLTSLMIVTDPFFAKGKVIEKLKHVLQEAGCEVFLFTEVVSNPRDIDCEKGAVIAKEKGTEGIIALGGGSAMDEGKAIAALVTNGGTCQDWSGRELQKRILPLICIPTTAGTGSEVTFVAVITDTKEHYKIDLFDECRLVPNVAILDPRLIDSLPPLMLRSTAMDALTHAIEAYTAKSAQPATDALALYAVEKIYKTLQCEAERPILQREKGILLYASTLAGMAFINANVGAVHALSETIGALYDIPHGIANAFLLPHIMRFNLSVCEKQYARLALQMNPALSQGTEAERGKKAVDMVLQLFKGLQLPTLKSYAIVKEKDFSYIAKRAYENVLTLENVREVTAEDYITILEWAYKEE